MSDRIHQHLDGDIPAETLSAEERARAAELDALLGRAAARLRAAPAPDLVGRVMAALPQPAPAAAQPRGGRWERAWRWLWSPRPLTISFRPGYALAAAAALALAVGRLPAPAADQPGPGPMARAGTGTPPPVYVQFRLNAEGAHRVELAGTFTGWKPAVPLRETSPGVWTALVPLRPGVHDYAFVVDGRWTADPEAPQVDDSFGGTNSRISLLPPGDAA
jgi:hypothetical protein